MAAIDTTPRMRGLLGLALERVLETRYNPAYAGTTVLTLPNGQQSLIQPRVCGDYTLQAHDLTLCADTTPRMRGLPHKWGWAGSILTIQPRVCGDYACSSSCTIANIDTTPRMRGLPCRRMSGWRTMRYNPAYAGTTILPQTSGLKTSIQPRVCGDYMRQMAIGVMPSDTTPRMRGLLREWANDCTDVRYNPAYAGTTIVRIEAVCVDEIQPRVCGDYLIENL